MNNSICSSPNSVTSSENTGIGLQDVVHGEANGVHSCERQKCRILTRSALTRSSNCRCLGQGLGAWRSGGGPHLGCICSSTALSTQSQRSRPGPGVLSTLYSILDSESLVRSEASSLSRMVDPTRCQKCFSSKHRTPGAPVAVGDAEPVHCTGRANEHWGAPLRPLSCYMQNQPLYYCFYVLAVLHRCPGVQPAASM